ncbi:MAG: hypothetical protein M1828_005110 [Chrysothrix sp. TS-e1954]|nr:MAG: hypothetical protein M1828_005110 [Chrysothrix sp. TS-e1954]
MPSETQDERIGPSGVRAHELLPNIIDDRAKTEPQRVWAAMPIDGDDLSKGFEDITYKTLANAINRMAEWIERTVGPAKIADDGSFPTIGYVGARDLRYPVLGMAAVKTGYKILFPSLFCTTEAHVHLMQSTGCQLLLCAQETTDLAKAVTEFGSLRESRAVPTVKEMFDQSDVDHFEARHDLLDAASDLGMIFHTSGSTGLPKPVLYSLEKIFMFHVLQQLPKDVPLVYDAFRGMRLYFSLPVFHVFGIACCLIWPLYSDVVSVMGPEVKAPSPEIADQVHVYGKVDGGCYSPAMLEDLYRDPAMRENMRKHLKLTLYGGAPLNKAVGDGLCLGMKVIVVCLIATTEAGALPILVSPAEEWDYSKFVTDIGIRFEDAGDGVSEMVMWSKPGFEKYQSWRTYYTQDVHRTKDLYRPHPTKGDLWTYAGRTDDMILLSHEFKLLASTPEMVIMKNASSNVRAVLVGGDRRRHPFLLIEPAGMNGTHINAEQVISDAWPAIAEANKAISQECQIEKSRVVVAANDKPFTRLAKGSVNRKATLKLYESEIDQVYDR